ncbi:MAG: glyceraldehyde 3-phosphate dehydrogenase NAD-binding domain-containing protein [Arsenophonus sp.]|nr:MAG: glyceraldehyde 3-phosphate dehydrogenase NAD-binding domain-containing protein [Arsenophonus sp.]
MIRAAINGFGRIGRNILRALYESKYRKKIVVTAINEITKSKSIAYLLKYDSTHGVFPLDVSLKNNLLFVANDIIYIFNYSKIKEVPWEKFNIDIVLDCTGIYGTKEDGICYLKNGIKKVLFSHLGEENLDNTVIYGVNEKTLNDNHKIVSNGSCTTNCIIPVIKILDKNFKIKSAIATVIHPMMNDQSILDNYNADLRKTRSSIQSIIPISTKLKEGVIRVCPKFKNNFDAISLRVPTINVTGIDLSVLVKNKSTVSQVNKVLKHYSKTTYKNIVSYNELPLVSVDFNHNSYSSIIDSTQTKVSGDYLIKVFVWCDNEWGFANRMLDTAIFMISKKI